MMNGITKTHIPIRVEGIDLTKFQLQPKEGFVLSLIDGVSTIEELKFVTRLEERELLDIVSRFQELGLVTLKEGKKLSRPSFSSPSTSSASSEKKEKSFEEKVSELYINIDEMDYYQLLGVPRDAKLEDIKSAYHKLTKQYHPDKLFRKGSTELRERLQYIFAHINEAYRVLSKKESRWEYDKTLRATKLPPRLPTAISRPDAGRKAVSVSAPVSGPPIPPPAKEKPRRIANPFMETVLKAKRLYELAMDDIKKKNFQSARQNLRIAASLDPFNKVYSDLIQKVEKMENEAQALKYYEEGLKKEKDGLYEEALNAYKEATILDSGEPKYYTKWARMLIEHKRNAQQAKVVINKAFSLGDKDPEQYLVKALVLKELGKRAEAQAELEKGLKIAPQNKELERELKLLKKGK